MSKRERKPSQCEKILAYMKQHGGITQLEATNALGITRLSARIFDLKEQGYNIEDVNETGKNRFGEKCRFVRYKVIET